jgi:TOMM system kinase/cyclase fusion protein
MDFYDVLAHVIELLRREGRVSYRALKRQFDLDDAYLEDLKDELLYAKRLAVDEEGKVLVWIGDTQTALASDVRQDAPAESASPPPTPPIAEAERRQLTVMFCDLVGSTPLSEQLDPEDLREVVRAYQQTCAEVIQRFDGHVAQLLGDALLVYFGWPLAHEDDAQRAVRAGLGMLEAMSALNLRLERQQGIRLAIRVGMHTGLVVVGEMGSGGHREHLALGDTPNIASRIQGLADPDTVLISADTHRLVQGYFTVEELGRQTLKGVAAPMGVYRVLADSGAQSRLDVAAATGFTPLVGRDAETALLTERWAQSVEAQGQIVLLSGEAGIGKSRLVEFLRQHVAGTGATHLALRCSPYHTNSAFYPLIEHLQRVLQWQRDNTPETKLAKLEQALHATTFRLDEVVPLLASLLSVPLPERYSPLALSPQRQRQQTQDTLVAWLLAEAARQPLLTVWEDLHWADPSTLETLGLLLEQTATTPILVLLTCRPEFHPTWPSRIPVTQITLNRLARSQVEVMLASLTGGKALPAVVIEQIVAKTDGVPLFVEELVKMLLESGLVQEDTGQYVLRGSVASLAIPATLYDSLMARLDRLPAGKHLAQLGAVLGREFSYELLQAVVSTDEATLQAGLAQLVEAEVLYQRGRPPQTHYVFKHALIQDAAYQALLKSTRQQYHQRIAQVLEAQFSEVVETQPEVLAYHYTEAGQNENAIDYWQRAGQRALQRSAHVEAIAHLTKGLAVLMMLPETPVRLYKELGLQTAFGQALMITRGYAAADVERAYARARELCQQLGDAPQLVQVLRGLGMYYINRGDLQTAYQLGEQLLRLAHDQSDLAPLMGAHSQLGMVWFLRGEPALAQTHHTQALAIYTPQEHRTLLVEHYGVNIGMACHSWLALELWLLGSPDQALQHSQAARALAQQVSHPFSLAFALLWAAILYQLRREVQAVYEQAAAAIALGTEQGFAQWTAMGMGFRGWARAMQGQSEQGLAEIYQGLATLSAIGDKVQQPYFLCLLAEAYGEDGQPEAGLNALAEALALMEATEMRYYAAELYRLKGVLLLRQAVSDASQAEACLHQALDIARQQQAKSFELRAATSLARLWQQQGKREQARELLAPIYDWFTEGFDTADLIDARALLDALA